MFNPNKNKDNKIFKSEQNDFKLATGGGNFLDLFQDPTSIGFKLFFINIADSSSIQNNEIIDTSNVVNASGLFGNANNPNSALYYLNSIGDTARFNMLLDFKKLLSELNTNYPWYFQTINGLDSAWARDYKAAKVKKEFTINCLESVDLRITALMDLYRKIAFDWGHVRAVLPDNLRKFDMSIKLFDVRKFRRNPGLHLNDNSDINIEKHNVNREFLGESFADTSQITFDFSHCEFLPDDSGSPFAVVSNSTYEHISQTLKIQYEYVDESNIFRSLVALDNNRHYYVRDYLNKELDFLTDYDEQYWETKPSEFIKGGFGSNNPNPEIPKSRAGEDNAEIENVFGKVPKTPEERKALLEASSKLAKQELGSLIEDIGTNISAEAARLVRSKLTSLYLGNVYGFSPSTELGTARNRVVTAPSKKLGNIFDENV